MTYAVPRLSPDDLTASDGQDPYAPDVAVTPAAVALATPAGGRSGAARLRLYYWTHYRPFARLFPGARTLARRR